MSSVSLVHSFLFHSTEKKNPDVSRLIMAKENLSQNVLLGFKRECT